MSFLDPIANGINSLLNPLTSGLGSDATSATSDASTPATVSVVESTTATSVPVTTPSSSSSTLAVSSASTAPTTAAATSSSTSERPSETSSSTRSTASSSASSSETTFSTSSTRASTSSISPSTTLSNSITSSQTRTSASSSSTPAAPSATPKPTTSSIPEPSSDGNKVSTAGIVIAAIVAFIVVVGIIYLVCRFCPPIRRRLDAWHVRRHKERSYREGIDGPAVPEKDVDAGTYASLHSRSTSSEVGQKVDSLPLASNNQATVSTATLVPTTGLVKEIDVAVPPTAAFPPPPQQKRNSFLNLAFKPNPFLPTSALNLKTPYNSHPHYPRELGAADATNTYNNPLPALHHNRQQGYTAPASRAHHPPPSHSQHNNGHGLGLGLGLGSVSMLRNNSLLSRKAGQHSRPPTTAPITPATQSKIATAGHAVTRSESQEVKRKPLPPVVIEEKQPQPLPLTVTDPYHTNAEGSQGGRAALAPYPSTATHSSLPAAANRASWTHGDEEVLSVAPRTTETPIAPVREQEEQDRAPTIPDIQIEAPSSALPQAVERISQIGMAVSSTPPLDDRAASGYVGVAK